MRNAIPALALAIVAGCAAQTSRPSATATTPAAARSHRPPEYKPALNAFHQVRPWTRNAEGVSPVHPRQ
jgi:hypothetical protein